MNTLEKINDLSIEELVNIAGGGIFGSDKSLTEWIHYGVGAIIGAVEQGVRNAAELRYEADANTLYGHYGGARP